jgi:hypothetical protein
MLIKINNKVKVEGIYVIEEAAEERQMLPFGGKADQRHWSAGVS